MKKLFCGLAVLGIVSLLSVAVLKAAEQNSAQDKDIQCGPQMCGPEDYAKYRMAEHKNMKSSKIMMGMMKRDMIATSDGGVVILFGNKLSKYDRHLNLVKEVELKTDMEGMHNKMKMPAGPACPMQAEKNDKPEMSIEPVKNQSQPMEKSAQH